MTTSCCPSSSTFIDDGRHDAGTTVLERSYPFPDIFSSHRHGRPEATRPQLSASRNATLTPTLSPAPYPRVCINQTMQPLRRAAGSLSPPDRADNPGTINLRRASEAMWQTRTWEALMQPPVAAPRREGQSLGTSYPGARRTLGCQALCSLCISACGSPGAVTGRSSLGDTPYRWEAAGQTGRGSRALMWKWRTWGVLFRGSMAPRT